MKNNDMNWAKLHDDEEETSSKAKTPINVSKMHEKDLFLHSSRDDSILSVKLIRIAPETSSF